MSNILEEYIRPVTDKDMELPEYSHSRLECYRNCAYQFDLKYNQNKVSDDTTIALELGSLLHLCLELKGKMLVEGKEVDYDHLQKTLDAGVSKLKKKYMETWYVADSEGRTYEDKLKNFIDVLHTEMDEDDGWTATYFEHPFSYVWSNRIRLHGFIDRIDTRVNGNGETEYRVVDYKTSKKVFDPTKNATSWQFAIYQGAILNEFGTLANESLYRFICINDSQIALTKGWENRFVKAMTKLLDKIDESYKENIWKISAGPLCYWCFYNELNPDAKNFKKECPYHSMWTPVTRDFSVAMEFNANNIDRNKRIRNFNW